MQAKTELAAKSNNSNFYNEAKSFAYIILLALSIRFFIFEPFHIPSGSMRKTLIEGDYVISTKYSYGYSKHSFIISTNLFSGRILESQASRGDTIIFRPPHQMDNRYIKRLIGLPGEKIEIKEGIVYVNDKPIERKFVASYEEGQYFFNEYDEILPDGRKYKVRYIDQTKLPAPLAREINKFNNMGPFFIPDDHYFFLGDNRDQSGDSRFELGSVPSENFISKAQFVLLSFSDKLWLDNPFSIEQLIQVGKWITSIRTDRFFVRI